MGLVSCGDDASVLGPTVASGDDATGGGDGTIAGDGTGTDGTNATDGTIVIDGTNIGTDDVSAEDAIVTVDGIIVDGIIQVDTSITADVGIGQDGTIIPGDTSIQPAQSCAGKCDSAYVKNAACQCDSKCSNNGDCCSDYQSLCGKTPPGSCVGKCGKSDNNWDCNCDSKCVGYGDCCGDLASVCPGTTPIATCVETNCAKEVATCTADAACAKILDCAKGCSDQKCLFGCAGGTGIGNLPPGLTDVFTCGNNAKCFQPGGTTSPVCGDSVCTAPEDATSCPKDCGGSSGGTTVDQCLAASCTKSYPACQADPACLAALPCVEGGKQVWDCINNGKDWQAGVTLGQLQVCGNQNKCFNGNTGGGGGGTGGPDSCAGKCGQINAGACQCQSWCTTAGICCKDYTAVCGGGGTNNCGDGVCAAASGENATTCPADCGTSKSCKTKSDCASSEVCCALSGSQVCVAAADCK